MKANAPEKLYIFNPERKEVWFSKTSDKQVEYTRTDAFIEKACEWLKDNITYIHPRKGTKECAVNLITFRDFMKGE